MPAFGLALMQDCGTGEDCEQQKNCQEQPVTVDVVAITNPETGTCKRYRLRADGFDVVWSIDMPAGTGYVFAVAYAPSFNGRMVATYWATEFLFPTLGTVDLDTGDWIEDLYQIASFSDGTFHHASQEASVNVAFEAHVSFTPALRTITPEGIVDQWGPGGAPFDAWAIGGSYRIGELIYTLDLTGTADPGNEAPRIVELEPNPSAVDNNWVANSDFTFDGGDFNAVAMVYDDARARFYVWGLHTVLGAIVITIDYPGATINAFTADLGLATGWKDTTLTLFSDALVLWDKENRKVVAVNLIDGTHTLVLEQTSGSTWPGLSGADGDSAWGIDFVVGLNESCNRGCLCEGEPTPTIEIERVFTEAPSEETCDASVVALAGCCQQALEVGHIECFYRYAYEITLCDGRELKKIIFEGARGTVFIEGVGPVDEFEDEDWAALPLTGFFFFSYGDDCGYKSGTLRITVIDDSDCCVRLLVPIECCQCCPVTGDVSVEQDEPEDTEFGVAGCDPPFGTDVCFNFATHICYVKFIFGEGSFTSCGDLDVEHRICYFIDWDGMQGREGGSPPTFATPGDEIRVKWDKGGEGEDHCVRIIAVDAIGGAECEAEPQYVEFRMLYSFPTGEIVPDPCADANRRDFDCPPLP